MRISKNAVVTLRYRVSDERRQLIDEGRQPLVYLHGGYGNTLAKIEEAMEGRARGYQTKLHLSAPDAFGAHDASLVQTVPRHNLPASTKVGAKLRSDAAAGELATYTVVRLEGERATLDANHPLAGQDVIFDLTVLDIRAASEEEIAHGHVHGAHGHHH